MIDGRPAVVLCCVILLLGFVDLVQCFKVTEKDERLNGLTSQDDFEEEPTEMSISRQRKPPRKPPQSLFERVLPMLVVPYLVQSAMLPMMLVSLKAMLLKSFLVGSLALLLGLVNALRTRTRGEEAGYKEHDATAAVMKTVYGSGGEEYGAYVHH